MKKIAIFLGLLLSTLISGVASASLYDYYLLQGQNLPSVSERVPIADSCGIPSYIGSYSQNIALKDCLSGKVLGTISRPELNYSKNITRGLSLGGSETTIYVSVLPNETTGYLIINPNVSGSRELIKYTGVTTTGGNQVTGVTRGLAEYGTTGSAISDSAVTANKHRHSSGETIIMGNGRYEQLIIDQLNGLSTSSLKSTDQNFTVGGGTLCFTGSTVCLRNLAGALQWSPDGFVNSYNFTSSSISQLLASSTQGIQVVNGEIGINASSTTGGTFDASGKYYQKIDTNTGLQYSTGSAGIGINTSTLVSLIATSTPTANTIVMTGASSTINTSWINTGTSTGQVVVLDSNGLPAVSGIQLTNIFREIVTSTTSSVNLLLSYSGGAMGTGSGSYGLQGTLTPYLSGYYRVSARLTGDGNGPGFYKIYKNGVAVGTEHSSNSNEYFFDDLKFASGEKIQMYSKGNGVSISSVTEWKLYGTVTTTLTNGYSN